MNKLKEYKAILILIAILLFGCFYWYEWRPSQIREKCFREAETSAVNMLEDKWDKLPNNSISPFGKQLRNALEKGLIVKKEGKYMYLKDDFDSLYINCLKGNGLAK